MSDEQLDTIIDLLGEIKQVIELGGIKATGGTSDPAQPPPRGYREHEDVTGLDPVQGRYRCPCGFTARGLGELDRHVSALTDGSEPGTPPVERDKAIRVRRMERAWAAWDRYCDSGDRDAWDDAVASRVFVYILEHDVPSHDRIVKECIRALLDHRMPKLKETP